MTTRNKYFRRSKISAAKFRQIVHHFALDLEAIARRDAEGIEHHVSPETLAAFTTFTRKQKA